MQSCNAVKEYRIMALFFILQKIMDCEMKEFRIDVFCIGKRIWNQSKNVNDIT